MKMVVFDALLASVLSWFVVSATALTFIPWRWDGWLWLIWWFMATALTVIFALNRAE